MIKNIGEVRDVWGLGGKGGGVGGCVGEGVGRGGERRERGGVVKVLRGGAKGGRRGVVRSCCSRT